MARQHWKPPEPRWQRTWSKHRCTATFGTIVGCKLAHLQSKSSQKGHPRIDHVRWPAFKLQVNAPIPIIIRPSGTDLGMVPQTENEGWNWCYHPRDIMTWNHNTSSCCGSEIASWNSRPLLPDMFFIKPISNQNHPIFSMYVHTNSFLVLTSSRRSFFIQKYDTHEVTPYPIPFCPSCSRTFQGLNLTIPLVNFEGVRIMANMTHMSRTLHWSWQDSKHAGEWPKDLERWGSISAGNLYSWPSYPIYLEV